MNKHRNKLAATARAIPPAEDQCASFWIFETMSALYRFGTILGIFLQIYDIYSNQRGR